MTGVFGEADRYLSLQIPLLQKPVDKLAFLIAALLCVSLKSLLQLAFISPEQAFVSQIPIATGFYLTIQAFVFF